MLLIKNNVKYKRKASLIIHLACLIICIHINRINGYKKYNSDYYLVDNASDDQMITQDDLDLFYHIVYNKG